ncbi:MAG: zinc ribbon domain-containing protein [Chloroflexota bacterium]
MAFGYRGVEEELAQRFVCAKCSGIGADVRSLAMAGTGLSRLLDWQRNEYVFVSCRHCGYTEVYNKDTIDSARGRGMDVLDMLFGH